MGGSVGKGLDRISNYCSEAFISIFCKVLIGSDFTVLAAILFVPASNG